MDLKDAGDEVYFVNVLPGGEEDEAGIEAGADPAKAESDKEMEKELVRAEAAMDLNIRRRAKKAGVEVLTPEDVMMSKAERDRVCEALGDDPGGQTKRRREIEEIKAEIKRTEEIVAGNLLQRVERPRSAVTAERRPKASLGRLPWMLLLLGVICGRCGSTEGFTAYDCSNRSNIVESYSLLEPDACAASDGNG
jgi:hypothetical protein